jgi:Pentapeptide repeats (8 copies)
VLKISVDELVRRYALGDRNFENIELIGANLQETKLQEINLTGSNLQGTILINANLQQACLDRINLSDASLMGANLNKASLIEANLDRANLANANLNEASLVGASLLDGTYLRGASLVGTLLNNARLNDAIFSKANLQGTHLNGACLKGATLGDADLKGAYYNDSTQFSSNFDPSQAGAIEVLSESHTVTITISQLLDVFNPTFQTSCKYLGNKISIKYLEKTKPNDEWLNRFEVDRNNKIVYAGSVKESITEEQLESLQLWFNNFQAHCCRIIPGFGQFIK